MYPSMVLSVLASVARQDRDTAYHKYTSSGLGLVLSRIDNIASAANLQSWDLDLLGDWEGTTVGSDPEQTRTFNEANEITGISGTWADPSYDTAGNMISGPKSVRGEESTRLHFGYDGW